MMKERAVTPSAQVMLREFQSPDWLVGLLVGSIPAGLGMLLGPIVSVRSDRHRGRWGRRIPFLLATTPFVALAMFGLAVTPSLGEWLHQTLGAKSPGLMASRILVFSLFWTAFEIGTIVVNPIFMALCNDVVPRELIGRFFGLFRAVSLAAGIVFNFFLMGKVATHSMEIFVALGLLYGIGFGIMCLKVKEGEYPQPPPESSFRRGALLAPVMTYLRECFSTPFYLWLYAAFILGYAAASPVNTFSIFHARSVGMSDDLYGKCLALSYTISLLIAYPLGALADRFHPLRLGLLSTAVYALVMLAGFLLPGTINAFFVIFVLHTVLSGVYLTGTASLGSRLLPSAQFAQLASAITIPMAIFFMVLPPALGTMIEVSGHQYRYSFLVGFLISIAGTIAYFVLFLRFKRLGGDQGYVPLEVK
ncbi:MAG: MFS transporter [Chthoniobacterales bacterium]|nr:MFS transporter [Chthoniobacterales bacterium]